MTSRKRRNTSSQDGDSSNVSTRSMHQYIDEMKFLPERYIQMEQVPETKMIRATITRHKWEGFTAEPIEPYIPIVKAFYESLASSMERRKCKVKGKDVSYSAESINEYYKSHFDWSEGDHHERYLTEIDWEEVEHTLSHGQGIARFLDNEEKFKQMCLSREAKAWHQFFATKLYPTKNVSEVFRHQQRLIFCALVHKKFNLGKVISDRIEYYKTELRAFRLPRNSTLGFPSLITGLCKMAGVPLTGQKGKVGDIMDARYFSKLKGAHGASKDTPAVKFYFANWGLRDIPGFIRPAPMPPFQLPVQESGPSALISATEHREEPSAEPSVPPQPCTWDGFWDAYLAHPGIKARDEKIMAALEETTSMLKYTNRRIDDLETRVTSFVHSQTSHLFKNLSISEDASPPPGPYQFQSYQWPPESTDPSPSTAPQPFTDPSTDGDAS